MFGCLARLSPDPLCAECVYPLIFECRLLRDLLILSAIEPTDPSASGPSSSFRLSGPDYMAVYFLCHLIRSWVLGAGIRYSNFGF